MTVTNNINMSKVETEAGVVGAGADGCGGKVRGSGNGSVGLGISKVKKRNEMPFSQHTQIQIRRQSQGQNPSESQSRNQSQPQSHENPNPEQHPTKKQNKQGHSQIKDRQENPLRSGMESSFLLLNRTAKYRKIIIFLAIVDIIAFAILVCWNLLQDFTERYHIWELMEHWFASKIRIIGKSFRKRILATWTLQFLVSLLQVFAVIVFFRMSKTYKPCRHFQNMSNQNGLEASRNCVSDNGNEHSQHSNPTLSLMLLKMKEKERFNRQVKLAVVFIVSCSLLQIPNIHSLFYYDYQFHLIDGISTTVDTLFRFLGLYFIFKFKRERERVFDHDRECSRNPSFDTEAFLSGETDDEIVSTSTP